MRYKRLKAFYLFYFIGFGALQFLNLYYANSDLMVGQIGVLFAVGPFVMIFAQPLWGMLTDYFHAPKVILFIIILGSACTSLFFPFANQFEHFFILNIIYFFFQSAIPPIADSTAMGLLDNRNEFGTIRAWGSFGYAVGVLCVGWLLDLFGIPLLFILHSTFLIIALLYAMKLPIKQSPQKRFKLSEAMGLFSNRTFIFFLLFSFFLHLPVHANNSFYAIHLQDFGATITLVGLALLIKSILEVPFFAMSKQLLNRYSFAVLLSVAGLTYAARWFVLGISDQLHVLVWSQALLSLAYSIQYFTSIAYVDFITPVKYRATGQTFYWAITYGLSGVSGNLLAGWLLDFMTVQTLYQFATIMSVLSITFIWLKPKKMPAEESE